MWSSTVVAVPVGLACGSFLAALLTLLAGTALACLLVLPPWPMYNKHHLTFLPAAAESDGDEKGKDEKKGEEEPKKTKKDKKKDEKKSQ